MSRTIGVAILLASSAAGADVVRVSRPVGALKGNPVAQARLERGYGQLPLVFEPNRGQVDKQVKWLARGRGYTLFLTDREAVMALREGKGEFSSIVRMRLAGSRPWRLTEGLEPSGGISNYFIGNDPKKWRTDIPHYRRVKVPRVYAGIDLVFYGNPQKLEYDLVVQPGADPSQIRLAYDGVKRIEVDPSGDLVLTTHTGPELRQARPRVYQEIEGRKVEVQGAYEVLDRRRVSIQVAFYDARKPLVIDPQLVYSTYVGGASADTAAGIAVDEAGSAYITGTTISANFPTRSPYQTHQGGTDWALGRDVFVTKLTQAGDALVYSTYLGGTGWEQGTSIAVDRAGSAYVTGFTGSADFPTQSRYQSRQNADDAFVTKLAPAGNALLYSTYLGGGRDDLGLGIAVDGSGSAYVTGWTDSADFPTQSPFQNYQGGRDAFVTKLAPAGNALLYSTRLGGSGSDSGGAIAVDGAGSAYVTGWTGSTNFPTQSPFQTAYQGGLSDAFVTTLTPAGNALLYSTRLGGGGSDSGGAIAVDGAGSAYVAGSTDSTNFPSQAAYQASRRGQSDAFVTKLTPAGNALAYSTYLGGSGSDWGSGIAVDGARSAYVMGSTDSTNFPTQSPFQNYQGGGDAFLTKLTSAGSALVYSTYLGGSSSDHGRAIAVDAAGNVYVAGPTSSADFPVGTVAFQRTYGGNGDAFVAKVGAEVAPPAETLTVTSVVNAASKDARLCPGVLAIVEGPNLAVSEQVSVQVSGRTAPVLIRWGANQLQVQIPVELQPGPTTLVVQRGELRSAPFPITLDALAPGLYESLLARTRNTVIDGRYHWAVPGEILTATAVGLGLTDPPVSTGKAMPARIVGATRLVVGGKPAEIVYAGLGEYVGLYVVTFRAPRDLAEGAHPVVLEVGGRTSNTVMLPVGKRMPVITSIVNGASFAGADLTPLRVTCEIPGARVVFSPEGRVAPGSLATIYYDNVDVGDQLSGFPATEFQGVSVTFNGIATPLFHLIGSRKQVNLLIPSELQEGEPMNIQLKTPQGTSLEYGYRVVSVAPGIFFVADPSRATRRNAIALFANTAWLVMPQSLARALKIPDDCKGSTPEAVCGQPASPGDVMQIYATGLGKATPNGDPAGRPLPTGGIAPPDGNPLYLTVQTPLVTIGGVPAEVLFSGLAPGFAGLYQLNVRIPDNAPEGEEVPLVISGRPIPYCDSATLAIRR